MTPDLLLTGLLQGLLLALLSVGIMIPFRLLNFPDLTAEGAYPLGAAVCTGLLLIHTPPLLALILGSFAAGLMGIATSLVTLRLNVNGLLAGIILSTMAYSVNLRLLGKPNIALFDASSLFSQQNQLINLLILLLILLIFILPLALFLRTNYGLKFRAVGLNPAFAKRQGISITNYTVLGLFVAGLFTGMAGGLTVQLQHYMDIGMGVGIVIHALAALMLGEALVGQASLKKQLIAPLVGALVYQQLQGIALSMGLAPSDLKFFTGTLVLLVIAMQRGKSR